MGAAPSGVKDLRAGYPRGRRTGRWSMDVLAAAALRLDLNVFDYLILALYFATVLGVGFAARRAISTSADFFLAGRSMPAWVTGLAFVSANLGALEIIGMAAN